MFLMLSNILTQNIAVVALPGAQGVVTVAKPLGGQHGVHSEDLQMLQSGVDEAITPQSAQQMSNNANEDVTTDGTCCLYIHAI